MATVVLAHQSTIAVLPETILLVPILLVQYVVRWDMNALRGNSHVVPLNASMFLIPFSIFVALILSVSLTRFAMGNLQVVRRVKTNLMEPNVTMVEKCVI